jgi:hypothetical protein
MVRVKLNVVPYGSNSFYPILSNNRVKKDVIGLLLDKSIFISLLDYGLPKENLDKLQKDDPIKFDNKSKKITKKENKGVPKLTLHLIH